MRIAQGNLWTFPAQYRCIPTNGSLDREGRLVMGAGLALDAKRRFPHLPDKLGPWIERYGNRPFLLKAEGLITFPTKQDWRDMSNLALIRESAQKVVAMADKHGIESVVLPQVGCGCGLLDWPLVELWIADVLDDRFVVVSMG